MKTTCITSLRVSQVTGDVLGAGECKDERGFISGCRA